jgi:hypothetical protein
LILEILGPISIGLKFSVLSRATWFVFKCLADEIWLEELGLPSRSGLTGGHDWMVINIAFRRAQRKVADYIGRTVFNDNAFPLKGREFRGFQNDVYTLF